MPDPEVSKIVTQLYGPSTPFSNSTGSQPASQYRASNPDLTQSSPPQNQLGTPAASASEPSPNQTSAPPTQAGPVKRSRQRPTKSCERCRAKKLKCDRELPCSNCKKGGRDGRDCEYRFGPDGDDGTPKAKRPRIGAEKNGENPHNNGPYRDNSAPDASIGADSTLPASEWLTQPESIARNPDWGRRVDLPIQSRRPSNTSTPLGRIDVKGNRTRYVGGRDKMAMLDYFEHSKCFIMKAFNDPEVAPMMQELSTFQRHYSPRHKCKSEIAVPYGRDELMTEMLKALPSGFLFGILQARYISNWETVVRILHIPTFMRECDELHAARQLEPLTTLPSHIPTWVVPQILAVTAIGSRLRDPSERSLSGEELSDEIITKNCLMVQRWLDELRGKAIFNLPILQTRALLLLARQSNLSHPSELCRRAGDLVRVAMTMGLHKDPESCEDMPIYDKEIRRKLWFTIVELDMQFALASGMPASITSSTFDVRYLTNIDDQDLVEDMQNYPASKGDDFWTNATAQIALAASTRDRLNATNMLGGCLDLEQDTPALLSHAKILEQALRSFPSQFRGSTRAGNSNNKRMCRLFTSIMLDMSLRRPLLGLYQTISTSSQSKRYPEARRGALRTSLAILSHLDALDPAVADPNTVKSRDYLNLFHLLCKADIMHSALIVCHEILAFDSSTSSSTDINEAGASSEESFPQTKHSLTRVVENTLNSILQRLGEFGSDLKDILPLAVVLQAVRSGGSDVELRESMIRGAERVLKECRKIMPSIEDAALLNSVARGNDTVQQHPAPTLPPQTWQTGLDTSMAQPGALYGGYGGPQTFGDFNVVPGDLNFADFDLGFGLTDWDLNQYWL